MEKTAMLRAFVFARRHQMTEEAAGDALPRGWAKRLSLHRLPTTKGSQTFSLRLAFDPIKPF